MYISKISFETNCILIGANCAPLVADLFMFFMKETSCRLFLTIIKLMLLKHLTLPQDIYMTCLHIFCSLFVLREYDFNNRNQF